MNPRASIKKVLGVIPFAAELAEVLRPAPGELPGGFRLDQLQAALPKWIAAARAARKSAEPDEKRRVLVIASLRWWLEYNVALSLVLSSLGHEVHLAYLPYRTWWDPVAAFDKRRQRVYLRRVLKPLSSLMELFDLSQPTVYDLPLNLEESMQEQSVIDVQYTLQREDLNWDEDDQARDLFQLRLDRNRTAASTAFYLLHQYQYDSVIIPNGSILEFGAVYRVVHYLDIATITFEFSEQRQRMWLAKDDEVMRLDTAALWKERGQVPLTPQEGQSLRSLYQARRGGDLWKNFARQWQAGESKGAAEVREKLDLDPARPIVLLCTNVVGDSLALGRQTFTAGMADWLAKTVRHFAERPEVQLVVRVHPGELLGAGHPSIDIIQSSLPNLPAHVIVVPPESKVNTYDLIEIAQFGLVYTTTVGMEMAMHGVPVVVSGRTHYRGKGFTYDPESLEDYFEIADQLASGELPGKLPQEKIDLAWRYAHRFFFEYPFPFPWHLVSFWEDIKERQFDTVIRPDQLGNYTRTLDAMLGKPIQWNQTMRKA